MSTRAKILMVDDYPANLLVLEAVLGTKDYDLVPATTGRQALELVAQHDFAAVLLDVQMPEMDGYEIARRIKALPRGKDMPIIFVTAVYTESDDVRRGYESGGLDYLAKPLMPELLRAKVRIYADLHRAAQELSENGRLLAQVRESLTAERKLEAVLDGISDGVIIEGNGKVTHINEQARRIVGGASSRPDRADELAACWANNGKRISPAHWAPAMALETGTISRSSIVIRCLDGSEREIATTALPIKDAVGIAGVVCILKAITP
jgi:CheY-like chemotaxis protein